MLHFICDIKTLFIKNYKFIIMKIKLLIFLIAFTGFIKSEHDSALFIGNYEMYEGEWFILENLPKNVTKVPFFEEENFENPIRGKVQALIYNSGVNLINLLDNGKLNNILQIIFETDPIIKYTANFTQQVYLH